MLEELEMGGFVRLRALFARAVAMSSLSVGLCALAVPPDAVPPAQKPAETQERPAVPARESGRDAPATQASGDDAEVAALDAVPEACWQELRKKRIYFVHRSVGDDLVKGMEDAMRRRSSVGLRVVGFDAARREHRAEDRREREREERERRSGEAEEPMDHRATPGDAFSEPGFVHADAGMHHAETKIDEFEEFLVSKDGAEVDVAILKLCYKDFGRSTDVATLVQHYAQAVDAIRSARPDLVVVHCTVPLREAERGFRRAVKDAVGIGGDGLNAVRGRYNEALRKRFPGEPMLDVARLESIRPDGTEATVEVKGAVWPALAKEYSEDGAHLNVRGRLRLGVGMLSTLASLCPKPEQPAAAAAVETAGPAHE